MIKVLKAKVSPMGMQADPSYRIMQTMTREPLGPWMDVWN